MKTFLLRLFHTMASTLRERAHLALKVMALRHQLAVVARSGKRPHLSPVDRCFWVLLSTMWARWTVALGIVQADTVRRWRRQGVWRSLRWWRPGKRPGWPAITAETRAMIRRLSQEHALWGAPRIHGELAMLGIKVSRTTVAKHMTRRPGPASQTWRTFLRNHACELMVGGVYADMRTRIRARLARMIRAFQHRLEERSDGSARPALTRDGVVPVLRSADVFTRPLQSLTHTSLHAWQERSSLPSSQAARNARLCDADTACAWTPDVRLMV
jgi:hypothetical protein